MLHLHLVPELPESERVTKPLGPVTCPDNVRLATIRDEPAILDLLLEDIAENATAIAPASISRIMQSVELATRQRGAFCPVICDHEQPVALALLTPNAWWWSETIFLQETVLYVTPSARRAHYGADLLRYECWLADQLSLASGERVHVLAGVTGTQRLAAKERLYGRHMQRVGGFYVYPSIDGLAL